MSEKKELPYNGKEPYQCNNTPAQLCITFALRKHITEVQNIGRN